MKTLLQKLLICAACIFVSACAGPRFRWDDARVIRAGMSTYEVEAIMGRPYLVSSKPDGVLVYVWTHVNGLTGSTRTFSVVFKNGKSLQPPEIPSSF